MDSVWFHRFIIFFTKALVINVFLPQAGNCAKILKGNFNKVDDNTGLSLSTPYKTSYDGRCAATCLFETGSPHFCVAFSIRPQDRSCDFYSFGEEDTVLTGVELYLLEVRDVFHPISVNGRTYSISLSSVKKEYNQAQKDCVSKGASLLHLDSLDQYEAMTLLLFAAGKHNGKAFIGANDKKKEGQMVYEKDGAPVNPDVFVWNPAEPDNDKNQDCVALDATTLKLTDLMCDYPRFYFCEKEV